VRRVTAPADQEGVLVPRLHPLLATAATRVAAGRHDLVSPATDSEDVSESLVLLATAVQRELAAVPAPIDGRVRSAVGRRLLDLLRAEVVRSWPRSATEHAAMPGILAAIERVREAIEAPWAEVASYLSGPDGLELAVDVAHDLRSPLSSILFLAETLQLGQSGPVNALQARQLGLIYCAALGLSALTDDMIDVARGGGHLVESEPVPFSVTAVLESVRSIVRPIAEEKHLAVLLAPPANDQRLGHPIALSRVLLNLTTNALKFTDKGFVEIAARQRGSAQIEFGVRDSGKGIDRAIVKTLYQPLRRIVGRTGRRFSQTGLGLTMCRRLIQGMDAELHVETRRGGGTRFFFELCLPTYLPASGARKRATVPAVPMREW